MIEQTEYLSIYKICDTINGLWTGKTAPYVNVKVYTMSNFTKESDLDTKSEPRDIEANLNDFEKRKLKYGDILIEKSGGGPNQPVGRAILFSIKNNENNTFSNFTTRLRIKNEFVGKINAKYLHYFLKGIYMLGETEKFQKNSTNIRNLQLKEYLELQIPFFSIEKQQQIISILDEAFAAIDQARTNIEKNIQNARDIFESQLNIKMVEIHEGQNLTTLNELCELIVDCEHKTAPLAQDGYPSIRTPNIGKGKLILEGVNRVSHETYIAWTRRAVPQAGDLILAREAPAGNIAVIPENIKVCLGQRTVLLRTKNDMLFPKYLAYLILSKDVQNRLLSHSTGATVQHINMKDIRAFRIGKLIPLQEQKDIVSQLEELQQFSEYLISLYNKRIKNLEELKKSILQKAFAGELKTKKVEFV